MKIIPFTHNGQQYEVRVVSDGGTVYVRAFKDNRPVNGYSYQVSFPVAFDMDRQWGIDAVEDLIEHAKRDVTEGAWEKLLAALRAEA